MKFSAIALAASTAVANAEIYMKEQFDDSWRDRWVESSQWKSKSEMGTWGLSAGDFNGDPEDKGIKTLEDARFYGLSAKLDKPFTNDGKDLVISYSVKHEQNIDCGGAYIKLMGETEQDYFGGDSPYQIMFGPDICGTSTKKTHLIFNYQKKNAEDSENLECTKEIKAEKDELTHLYTLHVKADGSYAVYIDKEEVSKGELEKDWSFLPAKKIKDPEAKKPADWVDEKMMPDPADVKPEGYDDIPAEIPDPDAEKPDDWDDEEDGEWEPPMIDNPEYKGEWKPKMIKNPDYKGKWMHPMIDNPDYFEDDKLAVRCNDCTHVGFELWQVKAGTIFDDIIVSDSLEEAFEFADKTTMKKIPIEREQYDEHEAEERKKQDADRAAPAGDEEEEEEYYEDGEDEEDHDEL